MTRSLLRSAAMHISNKPLSHTLPCILMFAIYTFQTS